MISKDSMETFAAHKILASLETYVEDGTTPDIPTSHEEIATLWDTCWEAWLTCDSTVHLELGAFMATIKAAYPSLPRKPSWAVVADPEEL